MMTIACYGASNTYGFDPRSFLGDRYPGQIPWPEQLATKIGCKVVNWGENGREIPHSRPEFALLTRLLEEEKPHWLVIDLGINDVLRSYPPSAQVAEERMSVLLGYLREEYPSLGLVLLAPDGIDITDKRLKAAVGTISAIYTKLGSRMGAVVADLGQIHPEMSYDGIHLSEAGHGQVADFLTEIFIKKLKIR